MENHVSSSDMRLCDVAKGRRVRVIKVTGEPGLKRRVLDMGLVPGTVVSVERKAPLNDPISVLFRGYELSLRLSEAETVVVKPAGIESCSCGRCN